MNSVLRRNGKIKGLVIGMAYSERDRLVRIDAGTHGQTEKTRRVGLRLAHNHGVGDCDLRIRDGLLFSRVRVLPEYGAGQRSQLSGALPSCGQCCYENAKTG